MSKNIDFSLTGGLPVDQNTLNKMQQAYVEFFKAIIAYIGIPDVGNFILTGVNVTGTDISSGWVYMDGDIIPFTALTGTTGLTTKFKKQTVADTLNFFDGVDKPVYITTSVIIDSTGAELSTFTRVKEIPIVPGGIVIDPAFGVLPAVPTVIDRIVEIEKKLGVFQVGGGMVLWNKPAADIPVGWAEVVNWRGRMPVGMDITVDGTGAYVNPEFSPLTTGGADPGRTGGAKGHTMTLGNLIEHDHTLTQIKNNSNSGSTNGFFDQANGSASGLKTDKAGSATPTPIPTLSPYRTVLFIEYIG